MPVKVTNIHSGQMVMIRKNKREARRWKYKDSEFGDIFPLISFMEYLL
jgi:hypothetical protein